MRTRNVNVTPDEMVRNGGLQAPPRAIPVAPLLLIAALLLGGCGGQPEVVSRVDHEGIEMTTLRSPALEGNLLGEVPEKLVAVYLPPGYEEEKERTYPVVYYLHGFGFGPTKLARVKPHLYTYFEMRKEDAMIVVAVDGNTEPGGSFWRNSPIIGNWADFAAEEVPEFVEGEYRVVPTLAGREDSPGSPCEPVRQFISQSRVRTTTARCSQPDRPCRRSKIRVQRGGRNRRGYGPAASENGASGHRSYADFGSGRRSVQRRRVRGIRDVRGRGHPRGCS